MNSVHDTVKLYESMTTAELLELRAAFELDVANATSGVTIGFGTVRIELIDDILTERRATGA
jgi:hypothetical protein